MSLPTPLQAVRHRPGMYVPGARYETVLAFVAGYDAALLGGLLVGFREWLIVRLQGGSDLWWPALLRELMQRETTLPEHITTEEDHQAAIEFMFATMSEFLDKREVHDGLHRIYLTFDEWLRQQSWYNPAHPEWLPR